MKNGMAVYSKYMKQQMKMIWTSPLRFFRVGTHIDNEEEYRNDRVGTCPGIRAAR